MEKGKQELFNMTFGERMQYYREKQGMTQNELAKLSEIPIGTLQKYEIDSRNPKLDVVSKISSALNVSIYDLIELKCDSKNDVLSIISQPNVLKFLSDSIVELQENLDEYINFYSERINYYSSCLDEVKHEKDILSAFSELSKRSV